MAGSNLFLNFGPVTYTYGGTPTTVTITKITDVDPGKASQALPFYGDAGIFPQLIATKQKTRTVKITSGDIVALQSLPEDTAGTLSWTIMDAKNGTGTGAVTYTLANAVVTANPSKAGINKFATSDVTFMAYSTDGVTDPLSKVVAS